MKELTQQQAQKNWNKILRRIRLAKFRDKGTKLPCIDMAQVFRGRATMTANEIVQEVTRIIEDWQPISE